MSTPPSASDADNVRPSEAVTVPGHEPVADPLAIRVVQACRERGLTIATCESLTAGLVASTLAQVPGASNVLRGGLVTYSTGLKTTLAGVDEELLDERGAVDPEVATQMAVGARSACDATIGLSCTGVAGPDPQDGKPVGTVFIAVAGMGPAEMVGETAGSASGAHVPVSVEQLALAGSRDEIRSATVSSLFTYLLSLLR